MKKIAICTFLVLAAFVLAVAPVSACNQLCRYSPSGDECVTVGWTTWQSCYMVGLSCIDYQCDGASSSAESVTFAVVENKTSAASCPDASTAATIYIGD